jgi:hydroxymethylpyrimidine/phosphomethylpyrimidine kinase
MQAVLGQTFINEKFINDLVPILTIDIPNLNEAAKLIGEVEVIPAAEISAAG